MAGGWRYYCFMEKVRKMIKSCVIQKHTCELTSHPSQYGQEAGARSESDHKNLRHPDSLPTKGEMTVCVNLLQIIFSWSYMVNIYETFFFDPPNEDYQTRYLGPLPALTFCENKVFQEKAL